MTDADYWKRIAEETHAKLLEAREALARTNSDKHAHYARVREALLAACVAAVRDGRVSVATQRLLCEAIDLAGGGK